MTNNEKIRVHSLKDVTDQDINIVKFKKGSSKDIEYKKKAHRRDDHYLFIFQLSGESTIIVDFKKIELVGCCVLCVLPGQIHYGTSVGPDTEAWLIMLGVNSVNAQYQEIFEDCYFHYAPSILDHNQGNHLDKCLELLLSVRENKMQSDTISQVTTALTNAFVGLVATGYRVEHKENRRPRTHSLTQGFRKLLLTKFRTHKSSSDYADCLHISPAYLNDVIKGTTGFTVSYWVQQAIITEAKRHLYYTDKTIKEIAYDLGFSDHAYFSRYFSRFEKISPTDFRLISRKRI